MMQAQSLSNLSMDGKIAVITGSTQGLGEAIAHLFVERGCAGLVICGRNAERGAKVKADLEAKGAKVVFVQADLAKIEDVRTVIAACDKAFGKIDALVNAAGLTDRGTIWDTTPEFFDQMFAINVKAPFFLMQDALHLMKKSKTRGSIVNILSMSGHGGQNFISAYCSSKGALATLTRNVAASVMKSRVRVNGLNIGWMDTPGEDRIMKTFHEAETGWLKKAEEGRPFGRLLKPAEVARACAYLCCDESGMMTGSIIDFDQQVLGAGNSLMDVPDTEF
jgi:NAD(P)-dependent dehydrogenase (short-subunit alcohol dehydrogenase family)